MTDNEKILFNRILFNGLLKWTDIANNIEKTHSRISKYAELCYNYKNHCALCEIYWTKHDCGKCPMIHEGVECYYSIKFTGAVAGSDFEKAAYYANIIANIHLQEMSKLR